MAVKTYYLASGQDNSWAAMVDGTVQTAATRADGWTVAKIAAANSCEFNAATKQASGSFSLQSGSAKPMSLVVGSPWNTIKSPAALTGTFAAAAFTLTFAVRATTASSQAGRMRLRVFKSANATGASATELTAATQVGTTSSALSTTADVTSVVTWTPAAPIVLNNEYLFFSIAWEITTASGSNSGDVQLRTGSAATPTGTVLATSNWVPFVAKAITPAGITNTQSASGSVQKYVTLKPVTPAGITNRQTVSGAPSALPPIIDDFNRADGAVYAGAGSAIWSNHQLAATALSNCVVSGNRLGSTTTSGSYQGTCVSLATVPGDFDLLFDCVVSSTGQGLAFYFCLTKSDTSSWNGMSIGYDSGGGAWWGTYYLNGGAQSLGNTPGVMPVAGETYKISKRGTAVSFYKATSANGPFTLINTWTTTTDYGNPGAFGLDIYDTTQRWDNVRGSAAVIPPAILDDFNRADGAVYAGAGAAIWRTNRIGSLALTPGAISSNQLMATANSSIITALVTTSDFDMMWDCVNTLGSSDIVTFYFCLTNTDQAAWSGAGIGYSSGQWYGTSYNNGSGSAWVQFAGSLPQAGETYWIRKRGTAFTFSKATSPSGPWTTIGTGTFPGGLGAGSVGIGPAQTTQRWDNLRAGPIPFAVPIGFVPSFSSYGAGGYGQDPYGGQQVYGITVISVKPVPPGAITNTNGVSGAVTELHRITPTTTVTNTQSVGGGVGRLRPIVPGAVTNTQSASGAVRPLRRILPAGITNTQSVGGAIGVARKITSGAITNTQSASGSLVVRRGIKPTTTVTNTQSVSGAITALRKIAPAGITNTQSASGAVVVRRGVLPTGITNSQQVTGSIQKFVPARPIVPQAVSNTQTVSGLVGRRRPIVGAATNTQSASGSLRALRKIAGAITNTQTASGAIVRLRRISAGVTNTQSVSGSLRTLRRIGGTITNTNTVSSAVTALRAISGTVPYDLGPIFYEADGLYDMELPVDLSGTNAVTLVFAADYQGGDGFGGLLFEYTVNINATNNGFWVTPGSEWGTVGAAETANKYPDGGYNVSEFARPSNGPHTWCVVIDRSVGVNPTKVWIDGVSHPVATYNGFTDTSADNFPNDVLYVGHRYGGGADLNGGVSMPLVFPYAFTDAAAQLASLGFAASGLGITNTQSVSGAIAKATFTTKPIAPAGIINIQSVSGSTRSLKKVTPAGITNTQSASGNVRRLRPIAGTATNTQSVSGSVYKPTTVRPIVPTGVTNTQSASGALRAIRKIAGAATNTQSVSGAVVRRAAILPGIATNTQTASGTVVRLRPTVPATITNTQTATAAVRRLAVVRPTTTVTNTQSVGGAVRKLAKVTPTTQVTNTQTISGGVTTRPIKIIVPAGVTNTQSASGVIRRGAGITPTVLLTFTNSVSGSIITHRAIKPGTGITNTNGVSGSIVALRAIKPAGITNYQTITGNLRVGRGIRPTTQITYTNNVAGNIRKLYVQLGPITNTNVASGAIRRLTPVKPLTTVTFTNVVNGAIGRRVLIRPATIITYLNAVSGLVGRARGIRPTVVINLQLVSGSVVSIRIKISAAPLHPGTIVHSHRGRTAIVGNTEGIQLTPANAEIVFNDRGAIQLGDKEGV